MSIHDYNSHYCITTIGVCISKWGNQSLDGCSFEGVQRILEADTGSTEVEVGFMKCRWVRVIYPSWPVKWILFK